MKGTRVLKRIRVRSGNPKTGQRERSGGVMGVKAIRTRDVGAGEAGPLTSREVFLSQALFIARKRLWVFL